LLPLLAWPKVSGDRPVTWSPALRAHWEDAMYPQIRRVPIATDLSERSLHATRWPFVTKRPGKSSGT